MKTGTAGMSLRTRDKSAEEILNLAAPRALLIRCKEKLRVDVDLNVILSRRGAL